MTSPMNFLLECYQCCFRQFEDQSDIIIGDGAGTNVIGFCQNFCITFDSIANAHIGDTCRIVFVLSASTVVITDKDQVSTIVYRVVIIAAVIIGRCECSIDIDLNL